MRKAHVVDGVPAVSIDGVRQPELQLAGELLNLAVTPHGVGPTPASPTIKTVSLLVQSQQLRQTAIAETVLNQLLLLEAKRTGREASLAVATATAQQVLSAYLSSRSKPPPLPDGVMPQRYFSDPFVINGYRDLSSIGADLDAILDGHADADARPILQQWFAGELAAHHILIGGRAPSFSLVDALPAHPTGMPRN